MQFEEILKETPSLNDLYNLVSISEKMISNVSHAHTQWNNNSY